MYSGDEFYGDDVTSPLERHMLTRPTRHRIQRDNRSRTWEIWHPTHGKIITGYINRNEVGRLAALLDAAQIDYTAPDAKERIWDAMDKARNP